MSAPYSDPAYRRENRGPSPAAREQLLELMRQSSQACDDIRNYPERHFDALLSDAGRSLLCQLLYTEAPVRFPTDEIMVKHLRERGVLVPQANEVEWWEPAEFYSIRLPGGAS